MDIYSYTFMHTFIVTTAEKINISLIPNGLIHLGNVVKIPCGEIPKVMQHY